MYIFHTKCCQSLVTERSVFSDFLENKFPRFSSEGSRTLQSMPFAGFLAHESLSILVKRRKTIRRMIGQN